ncbi:MAG: hypothetical protein ACP5GI_01180 [Sulfolobales archaeon]
MCAKINSEELIYNSLVNYINRIAGSDIEIRQRLLHLANKLLELNKIRAVSLNHSIMELAVAKYLIEQNYSDVDVEVKLDDVLMADVVGFKGGRVVIEIETGFVPAEYAEEPLTYLKARLASKIARYSALADVFILAFPTYYVPPIPRILLKKPSERDLEIIKELKTLIDRYYKNPPVEIVSIHKAYLHKLYALNIDNGKVVELSPEDLLELYEAADKITRNNSTRNNFIRVFI